MARASPHEKRVAMVRDWQAEPGDVIVPWCRGSKIDPLDEVIGCRERHHLAIGTADINFERVAGETGAFELRMRIGRLER